jgi:hypothetical protein
MVSTKQREAARQNIKKAQAAWQAMSPKERARSQPEGSNRTEPGMGHEGDYFRIIVRPKREFVTFRSQDVGDRGGLERLAGRRQSGSWATHAWLVSKKDAHIDGTTLVPDSDDARNLFESLRGPIEHRRGNIFSAKDRRNVPEKEKPTAAQKRARSENIKKAQAIRR